MTETCHRERCYCCQRGHFCEPDRYPTSMPDEWTCPDCGTRHVAFQPEAELAARLRLPAGTIGWRAKP